MPPGVLGVERHSTMGEEPIDRRPTRWIVLSERLKDLRVRHNVSQEAAADAGGVSRETWIDWEGSKRSRERGRIPDERIFDAAVRRFAVSVGEDPNALLETTTYAHGHSDGFAASAKIRGWRGVHAANSLEAGCCIERSDPIEIPAAFLVGGPENANNHDAVQVSGTSMEPRIYSGEVVVVLRERTPRRNTIVLMESPEGAMFLKVLRTKGGKWQLESIHPDGLDAVDLEGWTHHGYAVAIIGDPDEGSRNIEWNFGRPLKA